MSSFICSAKHFNSIEESIFQMVRNDKGFYCYSLKDKFPVLYNQKDYDEAMVFNEVKNLVDTLRDLNVVCVTYQYASHYEDLDQEIKEQKELVHERKEFKTLTKWGLLKALLCVNYQIETEQLERPLNEQEQRAWDFLDIISDCLAYKLVTGSKEYDKEDWEVN